MNRNVSMFSVVLGVFGTLLTAQASEWVSHRDTLYRVGMDGRIQVRDYDERSRAYLPYSAFRSQLPAGVQATDLQLRTFATSATWFNEETYSAALEVLGSDRKIYLCVIEGQMTAPDRDGQYDAAANQHLRGLQDAFPDLARSFLQNELGRFYQSLGSSGARERDEALTRETECRSNPREGEGEPEGGGACYVSPEGMASGWRFSPETQSAAQARGLSLPVTPRYPTAGGLGIDTDGSSAIDWIRPEHGCVIYAESV